MPPRRRLAAAEEANQWAAYHAQSLKAHNSILNRDNLAALRLLETNRPKAQKYFNVKLKEYDDQFTHADKEKDLIKQSAENIIKEQEGYKLKTGD